MRFTLRPYSLAGLLGLASAQFDSMFEYTDGPLSPSLRWFTDQSLPFGGWVYSESTGYLQSTGSRTDSLASSFILHLVGSGFRVHGQLNIGSRDPSSVELGDFWVMPNVTTTVNITGTDGLIAEWVFEGAVRPLTVHVWFPDNMPFTLHNVTTLVLVSTEAPNPEEWAKNATFHPAVVNYALNPAMSTQEITAKDLENFGATAPQQPVPEYLPPRFLGEHLMLETGNELVYTLPVNTSLVTVRGPVGFNSEWDNAVRANMTKTCSIMFDPLPEEGYQHAS